MLRQAPAYTDRHALQARRAGRWRAVARALRRTAGAASWGRRRALTGAERASWATRA